MYCSGGLFVGHALSYVHIGFQMHLTAHETLKAKEQYELMPQDLLTDNGSVITSRESTSQIAKFEQVIRFVNTGAQHHNALAKQNNKSL